MEGVGKLARLFAGAGLRFPSSFSRTALVLAVVVGGGGKCEALFMDGAWAELRLAMTGYDALVLLALPIDGKLFADMDGKLFADMDGAWDAATLRLVPL